MLDSSIVRADLTRTLQELKSERHVPETARRRLAEFTALTQKLTDAIRHEYLQRTSTKWSAATFDGWDEVTALFKALRNADQHGSTVKLEVHEKRRILARQLVPGAPDNLYLTFEGEQALPSQLHEFVPDTMTLHRDADGQPGEAIPWSHHETTFFLASDSARVRAALSRVATRDIYELAEHCLNVLTRYHDYYLSQLPERSGI